MFFGLIYYTLTVYYNIWMYIIIFDDELSFLNLNGNRIETVFNN